LYLKAGQFQKMNFGTACCGVFKIFDFEKAPVD
jgi:hypothetical protein